MNETYHTINFKFYPVRSENICANQMMSIHKQPDWYFIKVLWRYKLNNNTIISTRTTWIRSLIFINTYILRILKSSAMHNKSSQNLHRRNFINVPRSNLIGCQTRKKRRKKKVKKEWHQIIGCWLLAIPVSANILGFFYEVACSIALLSSTKYPANTHRQQHLDIKSGKK